MQLLTNNCEIVAEASSLGVPEVDSTPVHPLVVPSDVVYDELGRFGRGPEVSSRAEHFRCGPVACLRKRLASNIQAEKNDIV